MDNFPTLALQDPLEGHEVIISLRVKANTGAERQTRAVLVSVGIAGEIPLISETAYDQIETTINQLWIAAAKRLNLSGSNQPPAGDESDSSGDVAGGDAETSEAADAEVLFVDEDDLF
jgi:hypothetical protein